jgi:hypothetical protein
MGSVDVLLISEELRKSGLSIERAKQKIIPPAADDPGFDVSPSDRKEDHSRLEF